MFGLFKKKNKAFYLNKKYKALMQESYEVSKINRMKSDLLFAQAQEIIVQLEAIKEE